MTVPFQDQRGLDASSASAHDQVVHLSIVALAEEEDSPQQECYANNGQCHDREEDYLIEGAGGGGIRTALLLKRYGYSFRVLEKEDTAASFWTKFPALQELILVTQKVQNETQHFPYDWYSMLEFDLAMQDVSADYYPNRRDWHEFVPIPPFGCLRKKTRRPRSG